jgi:signal transduction histidine kinase
MMKKGIVIKIFWSIVGIFVLVMLVQLAFQNFFLEDIYLNMKISKVERSFDELVREYEQEHWSKEKLNEKTDDYQNDNSAAIVLFNGRKEVLNDIFFRGFNYIRLRDENGGEHRVIIDFLIDEEGNFKNQENDIREYEKLNISGMKIDGTNFIMPLGIDSSDMRFINDDGYELWDELYNQEKSEIVDIVGTVIGRNFIIRDQGVESYQQEKLFTEVNQYWVEESNLMEEADQLFIDGRYEYTEEYSGLMIVVLAKRVDIPNGGTGYAFSLFTLQNVHDAFQILNGYYYYIFGFQLLLILILVYKYSKWITKPLIKMIDSAKSISELDFTKRTSVNSNDELEILSDSLNDISENLSMTIEELEASNDELAIEAIKKAENEERMRNLLNSLSHEFKTPLGIMSGFLEIIRDGVYEKEPEYYMDAISEEIEKLNGLVLETIELSKLETGSYKLNLSQFDIKPFIENIFDKFENDLRYKNMSADVYLQDIKVIADQSKIEQVIKNLVSNGIRYSSEGESIEVRTKIKEKSLYVGIRNYGAHIEEHEIEQIWNSFYRVEKSRNKEHGGSGLGLTIVKNILDIHKSDYGVRNLENSVEFYFSLEIVENI